MNRNDNRVKSNIASETNLAKNPEDVMFGEISPGVFHSETSSDYEEASQNPENDRFRDGYIGLDDYRENISIGDYIIVKELGTGSSAKVVLAFNKVTERKVAIKIMKRNGISQDEERTSCKSFQTLEDKKKDEVMPGFNDLRIFREVIISSLVDNPHIVKLLDFLYSSKNFFLIFEYVKGHQLYDVVLKNTRIPEERARKYFRQIVSAVDYLHKNSIVHRDLKIENIVIDHNDNVKIIDFGLSNFFDNTSLLQTFCGSLYFAAPELLMGMQYNGPEVDVWSLGVILYVMLCGKVPFDDESVKELQSKIKEASLVFDVNISEDGKDLISKMVVPLIQDRFSLAQVIKSKWINHGYTSRIENFLSKRFPLAKINEEYLLALSTVLKFQFPNAKDQLESFYINCNQENGRIDSIYWIKNPVVSLYYLLSENVGSYSKGNAASLTYKMPKSLTKFNIYNSFSDIHPHDYHEALHNFVKLVFANDPKNIPIKYFIKSVFKESDMFFEDAESRSVNYKPLIKPSYFKGIFQGIKVKHIGSHNALKKIILDIFKKNSVSYEAEEKGYFCSFYYNNNECYFKVSLYYNVIFSEYYLVLKCLNSQKEPFRIIYDSIQSSLKYRT